MGASWDNGAIRRALTLGIVVFVVFVIVSGALWALGTALGLTRTVGFLLGVCVGPLLVASIVLGWLFALPLERRQQVLGVRPSGAGQPGEQAGATVGDGSSDDSGG